MDELGRLFLGDVRRRQTQGEPAPRRIPPVGRQDLSIDLTPEEFAGMCHQDQPAREPAGGATPAPMRAVVGSHLNGRQSQYLRHYAGHEASRGRRVGLIELDGAELRVSCFEPASSSNEGQSEVLERGDGRSILEALREMDCDVGLWILSSAHQRAGDARELFRDIEDWTLLATCDHDGVVAAYRTLKGLKPDGARPKLSVALLDAPGSEQANVVFDKLSGVCLQFLNWPIQERMVLSADAGVSEQLVVRCGFGEDPVHLRAVRDFIAARRQHEEAPMPSLDRAADHAADHAALRRAVAELVLPEIAAHPPRHDSSLDEAAGSRHAQSSPPQIGTIAPAHAPAPAPVSESSDSPAAAGESQVLELPAHCGHDGLLEAIIRHEGSRWASCPVRPPMCPEARLTVGTDRRLTLAAAARVGLANLEAIARAYHWLRENRELIAMAMPQLAIDPTAEPMLWLFVDQADLSAQALRPLLESRDVHVRPYRRLRWGERTGLLLEAA